MATSSPVSSMHFHDKEKLLIPAEATADLHCATEGQCGDARAGSGSQQTSLSAHKRHSRDVFHSWMLVGAEYVGPLQMPKLAPIYACPNKVVAFSDAMRPEFNDYDRWVHFFEDDDILNRFWNNPRAYLKKLRKFQGVFGLDYSVGWNFPSPVKYYNHFRNSACTFWLQQQGIPTVPQARCEATDYVSVLAGFPRHSTLAIGARAMVRRTDDRKTLKTSVKLIVDYLEPTNLLWYGSTQYGVTDYPRSKEIPITVFPGKGRGELSHHQEERDA